MSSSKSAFDEPIRNTKEPQYSINGVEVTADKIRQPGRYYNQIYKNNRSKVSTAISDAIKNSTDLTIEELCEKQFKEDYTNSVVHSVFHVNNDAFIVEFSDDKHFHNKIMYEFVDMDDDEEFVERTREDIESLKYNYEEDAKTDKLLKLKTEIKDEYYPTYIELTMTRVRLFQESFSDEVVSMALEAVGGTEQKIDEDIYVYMTFPQVYFILNITSMLYFQFTAKPLNEVEVALED